MARCPSSVRPQFAKIVIRTSEEPETRSDHRRIVPAIQEYDTTVDLVIFECSNIREFMLLGLFTKFKIRKFSFSLVELLK